MAEPQLERMRAIVKQAVAEAARDASSHIQAVYLIVYGAISDAELDSLFKKASQGGPAEGATLEVERAGSRYICWNCCGLRFESADGICPNCGEVALEIPEDIEFGLKGVKPAGA